MNKRLLYIDATRGLIIIFMLLDHVRETFFLHLQVSDPMNVLQTPAFLYTERILSHLCAPLFVFLAGVSAYLFSKKNSIKLTRSFLFKRGLFLIFLEITIINFAWSFEFPPSTIFLQVLWATGLSMIILSFLISIKPLYLTIFSLCIITLHNTLDPIWIENNNFILHAIWSIIHQRDWIYIADTAIRISYPVLPLIGIITLGWSLGYIFIKIPHLRQKQILSISLIGFISFVVLRFFNIYGDKLLESYHSIGLYLLNFVNLTKYPASVLFIICFLSIGFFIAVIIDKIADTNIIKKMLVTFGSVPMFFYIVHLYVLKILYIIAIALFGFNKGDYFGLDSWWSLYLIGFILLFFLYFPTRWFSQLKQKRKDIVWLKYL